MNEHQQHDNHIHSSWENTLHEKRECEISMNNDECIAVTYFKSTKRAARSNHAMTKPAVNRYWCWRRAMIMVTYTMITSHHTIMAFQSLRLSPHIMHQRHHFLSIKAITSKTTTTRHTLFNNIGDVQEKSNGEARSKDITTKASEEIENLQLAQVDVRYNNRFALVYDAKLDRYVASEQQMNHGSAINTSVRPSVTSMGIRKVYGWIQALYIPEGVTSDYFEYVRWRVIQRYVNAIVHVFGTQSLLLGLGIKNRNALGLGAAMNWVLKDALGKITRMAWAGKMGRKFDCDAKRWRFRASFLFATGNFLEIATFLHPQNFLFYATIANCLKQVSMLTSSATRNAIYNSFRDSSGRENIGDITAKGEAQVATVDLLGIASGVCLSRLLGVDSARNVLIVYGVLQCVELLCMYREIRAVVSKMLNFERLWLIVEDFTSWKRNEIMDIKKDDIDRNETTLSLPVQTFSSNERMVPNPTEMAQKERIFLPPKHMARRAIAFGSLGRAKLSPGELSGLLNIFQSEKFLLVVGADVKNSKRGFKNKNRDSTEDDDNNIQEQCHVVLREDADNVDIVKSTLALACLRRNLKRGEELRSRNSISENTKIRSDANARQLRTAECLSLIKDAKEESDTLFPLLLNSLQKQGWTTGRYMFGKVRMRADWSAAQQAISKKVHESMGEDLNLTSSQPTNSTNRNKVAQQLSTTNSTNVPNAPGPLTTSSPK